MQRKVPPRGVKIRGFPLLPTSLGSESDTFQLEIIQESKVEMRFGISVSSSLASLSHSASVILVLAGNKMVVYLHH